MKNDGLTGMDRRGKALTIWTLAVWIKRIEKIPAA